MTFVISGYFCPFLAYLKMWEAGNSFITVSAFGLELESSHGTIVPRKKEEAGGVRRN